MPELPEVETVIKGLRGQGIVGKRLAGVTVTNASSIAQPSVAEFRRQIKERTVECLGRRGKYIVISLDGGWTVLVHLRMSGRLLVQLSPGQQKHVHVQFRFEDGSLLAFYDPRKFGRVWLTNEPETILCKLGVEPLARAFSKKACRALLSSSKRKIKVVLLDQSVIAGLGNIYTDEALWVSGVHPAQPASTLTIEQCDRLHDAIVAVLKKGIRNLGTSLGSGQANFKLPQGEKGQNKEQLHVYGRQGGSCFRCGTPIEKMVVAQRGTHWCPLCQPLH